MGAGQGREGARVEGLLGGGAGRVVPALGRAAAALGAGRAVAGRAGGRRRRGRGLAARLAAAPGTARACRPLAPLCSRSASKSRQSLKKNYL